MMNAAIVGDDDDNDDDDGDDEDNSDLFLVSNCMLDHEVVEGRVSFWLPDSTTIVLANIS